MKVKVIKDFYTVDGQLHLTGDLIEVNKLNPEYMEKVNSKSKSIKEKDDVSED